MTITPQPYDRPEVDEETRKQAAAFALRLVRSRDNTKQIAVLTQLLWENARLVLEVNEHRAARGFEPLRVFDAPK